MNQTEGMVPLFMNLSSLFHGAYLSLHQSLKTTFMTTSPRSLYPLFILLAILPLGCNADLGIDDKIYHCVSDDDCAKPERCSPSVEDPSVKTCQTPEDISSDADTFSMADVALDTSSSDVDMALDTSSDSDAPQDTSPDADAASDVDVVVNTCTTADDCGQGKACTQEGVCGQCSDRDECRQGEGCRGGVCGVCINASDCDGQFCVNSTCVACLPGGGEDALCGAEYGDNHICGESGECACGETASGGSGRSCEANEVCADPNSDGDLSDAQCGCIADFGDCDGDLANGCETDLSQGVDNTGADASCGACGQICTEGAIDASAGGDAAISTAACVGGVCTVSCDADFYDCDADPYSGCEQALDGNNCGACDLACGCNSDSSCLNPSPVCEFVSMLCVACDAGVPGGLADGNTRCESVYPGTLPACNSVGDLGGTGACVECTTNKNDLCTGLDTCGVSNTCECELNSGVRCTGPEICVDQDGEGTPVAEICECIVGSAIGCDPLETCTDLAGNYCDCGGNSCPNDEICTNRAGADQCICGPNGGSNILCTATQTCYDADPADAQGAGNATCVNKLDSISNALVITEVMVLGRPGVGANGQYIELINTHDLPLEIAGLTYQDTGMGSAQVVTPNPVILNAGARMLIVKDLTAYSTTYSTLISAGTIVVEAPAMTLGTGGSTITVLDTTGGTQGSFTYGGANLGTNVEDANNSEDGPLGGHAYILDERYVQFLVDSAVQPDPGLIGTELWCVPLFRAPNLNFEFGVGSESYGSPAVANTQCLATLDWIADNIGTPDTDATVAAGDIDADYPFITISEFISKGASEEFVEIINLSGIVLGVSNDGNPLRFAENIESLGSDVPITIVSKLDPAKRIILANNTDPFNWVTIDSVNAYQQLHTGALGIDDDGNKALYLRYNRGGTTQTTLIQIDYDNEPNAVDSVAADKNDGNSFTLTQEYLNDALNGVNGTPFAGTFWCIDTFSGIVGMTDGSTPNGVGIGTPATEPNDANIFCNPCFGPADCNSPTPDCVATNCVQCDSSSPPSSWTECAGAQVCDADPSSATYNTCVP